MYNSAGLTLLEKDKWEVFISLKLAYCCWSPYLTSLLTPILLHTPETPVSLQHPSCQQHLKERVSHMPKDS